MPKRYQLHHGVFTVHYLKMSGLCVMPDRFDPGSEEFSITVDVRERGKSKLDTLIHELLHAEHPQMNEKDVERTATNIANVLHGEGYREKA